MISNSSNGELLLGEALNMMLEITLDKALNMMLEITLDKALYNCRGMSNLVKIYRGRKLGIYVGY